MLSYPTEISKDGDFFLVLFVIFTERSLSLKVKNMKKH